MNKIKFTPENLKDYIHYDQITGYFTWNYSNGYNGQAARVKGERAEKKGNGKGYMSICVLGQNHQAHRLAVFIMTGEWPKVVHHINRNKHDNRWCNLEITDYSGNLKRGYENGERPSYKHDNWSIQK